MSLLIIIIVVIKTYKEHELMETVRYYGLLQQTALSHYLVRSACVVLSFVCSIFQLRARCVHAVQSPRKLWDVSPRQFSVCTTCFTVPCDSTLSSGSRRGLKSE